MAGTRSSTRQAAAAANSGSNSSQNQPAAKTGAATRKQKGSTATGPKSKRGKKSDGKEQATIEATMPTEGADSKDVEMTDDMSTERDNADANEAKDSAEKAGGVDTKDSEEAAKTEHNVAKEKAEPVEDEQMESGDGKPTNGHVQGKGAEAQPVAESDQATNASKVDSEPEENTANGGGVAVSKSGDAVEKSPEREQSTPSSILEKGIIYFFFRGRVNIDEPSDVDDIARSYIVLRPLPHGAKLGDGPIGDAGNNRLLALPKKVLPVSPKDRFMVFVEKPSASMEEIKNALASSDYMTKTAGARHTPAAAPIGEGVYAITTTGRESYIAYMLTIPSELSEVQHDVGLKERGSFVTSVKNPQYPGPTNTNLPKGPEFPQEILDEFRSLRWMPLQPKLLDYVNTQILIIGHKDDAVEKATVQQSEDEKKDKDTPMEEMEKLEHEDELRVEHLKGDDSIFEDLGMSSKEYPKVQTTW